MPLVEKVYSYFNFFLLNLDKQSFCNRDGNFSAYFLFPAYGMFIKCGETRNVWFNSHSFESDSIFELTGMILGLAIYNGIILDLPLPGVLYAKLRGRKPTLKDVWDIEPTVARSLTELLDYNGDIEEEMCLDFQVS